MAHNLTTQYVVLRTSCEIKQNTEGLGRGTNCGKSLEPEPGDTLQSGREKRPSWSSSGPVRRREHSYGVFALKKDASPRQYCPPSVREVEKDIIGQINKG